MANGGGGGLVRLLNIIIQTARFPLPRIKKIYMNREVRRVSRDEKVKPSEDRVNESK